MCVCVCVRGLQKRWTPTWLPASIRKTHIPTVYKKEMVDTVVGGGGNNFFGGFEPVFGKNSTLLLLLDVYSTAPKTSI